MKDIKAFNFLLISFTTNKKTLVLNKYLRSIFPIEKFRANSEINFLSRRITCKNEM